MNDQKIIELFWERHESAISVTATALTRMIFRTFLKGFTRAKREIPA